METLLVGIDAGCTSVLDPLIEEDIVPNLEAIFEAGATGPLESQIPPWTPSAWPSLYTGVNPGKHGVFCFIAFDGYDWDVVNSTHVREYALWELLDHHGYSSVVVNAPVTHPPRKFDGAIVPGYTAPEDPDCHPDGVLSEFKQEIGDYRVYAPRDVSETEKVEWYERLVGMRGEAFRYLADRFDPEFGFVQFQQTDTVFHEFPGNDEKVRAVYEAVDEQVGRILEQCDPDTVVVASDHGIGEYTGHEFRLNEFLREKGLVEVTKGEQVPPPFHTIINNQLGQGKAGKSDETSPVKRGLDALVKWSVASKQLRTIAKKTGVGHFLLDRVPDDVAKSAVTQVDFPASTAYMRDRTVGLGVRVNLAGREPEGVVPESEYDRVCEELVAMLSDVETPDGKPMFERVVRREDVFSGPYVEEAPDVITVPREYDESLSVRVGDGQFAPPSEPYNHKRDGIVAIAGAGVDTASDLSGANLLDVAPTILATLGLPAGERMDGDVLPAVEAIGTEPYPAFDAAAEVATDDSEVEARLADLGYIE